MGSFLTYKWRIRNTGLFINIVCRNIENYICQYIIIRYNTSKINRYTTLFVFFAEDKIIRSKFVCNYKHSVCT